MTEVELERLSQILNNRRIARILIAGGGKGGSESRVIKKLSKGIVKVSANINKKAYPDVIVDLTAGWPFSNGVFDAIVSTWVLEHLRDPWIFFREANRVLTQGGLLIVTVPFVHRVHGSPFDYWRFTDTALVHLTQSAGFKLLEVKRIGGTPFLCIVNLLWPFFKVPGLGALLAFIAVWVDTALMKFVRLTGKGKFLIDSYPLSYILIACKEDTVGENNQRKWGNKYEYIGKI